MAWISYCDNVETRLIKVHSRTDQFPWITRKSMKKKHCLSGLRLMKQPEWMGTAFHRGIFNMIAGTIVSYIVIENAVINISHLFSSLRRFSKSILLLTPVLEKMFAT